MNNLPNGNKKLQDLKQMKIQNKDPRDYLIVALDVPSRTEAIKLAEELSGRVGYFKIGLQLFYCLRP
jgi:orotidine-5'-phosphate decarboxylase